MGEMTTIGSSVLQAIGHTPLVRLIRVVPPGAADVLVKLESLKPDRLLQGPHGAGDDRRRRGPRRAAAGHARRRVHGRQHGLVARHGLRRERLPVLVLSSDAFAQEKLLTMTAFGAELRIVPSDGGKVTPALFERFRAEIATLAAEPDTFWTDQFHNADALDGYAEIGRELLEQTGGRLDAFCGAVGTGGMLAGVARALRDGGSRARIVALEPAESPAMTEGRGGAHRVEGIATGSIPPHMTARAVRRGARDRRGRRLARWRGGSRAKKGLLVGTSSGLNIAAAVAARARAGAGKSRGDGRRRLRPEVSRRRSLHRAVNCRRTCAMSSLCFGARHTCAS